MYVLLLRHGRDQLMTVGLKVLYPTTRHLQQSEETPGALTIILSQQREAQCFIAFHLKYFIKNMAILDF